MSVNAVKPTLDSRQVPDGTILLFGIRYTGTDSEGYAWTRKQESKVYTYAMLKAGGFWYVTGGGKTPQVAGWGAIGWWVERDGRRPVRMPETLREPFARLAGVPRPA